MSANKIRVIITGVTGMVGEGVLHECLLSPDVEKILVVSRRPCGVTDPKLSEIICPDFFELSSIESTLSGYNACFFCLGMSSVGVTKDVYEKMTYDLTMGFAKTIARLNADMTFCYISGAGTDSTEKGRLHWARVKGRTENDLQKLGFRQTYLFRPGILRPTKGLKNTLGFYKWLSWLLPVFEIILPSVISSLAQLGQAMIHSVTRGYDKKILEVKDIKILSKN
ncbi:MAG: epimerase [Bacteroidota bacterium]|nr:epimerase [Bacteroidota bacterium]